MSKWIKPSELPEGFWGECFVTITDGTGQIFVEINDVKMKYTYNKKVVRWYSLTEKEWMDFRDDVPVLVMPIEYPKISLEDFK